MTHPLWRRFELITAEQQGSSAIRPRSRRPRRVDVVAPDPSWPDRYAALADRIRDALVARALGLQHVGSTSVPGLWAKPVIDIDLAVADPADEAAYVPPLEAAGFRLDIREPDWEQHRCLLGTEPRCNLHVFGVDAVEPQRHRMFRDWLREHPDDRETYGALKRDLSARTFESVMDYNNAKAALIYDVYERIFAADPEHEHLARPRKRGAAADSSTG